MQTHYAQRYTYGFPGLLDGIGQVFSRALVNAALDAANKWTIGIPSTVDANKTYSIQAIGGNIHGTVSPLVASFDTGSSPSQATLGSGLLAAIQATDLMQFFNATLEGNTITLEGLRSGIGYTVSVPTNGSTTNDLVLTEATQAALSSNVPMGRFVVQLLSTDGSGVVRLPTSNSGVKVRGVTGLVNDQERRGVGDEAVYEYYPNHVMDVVHRTANGIWVECSAADIKSSQTLYIDCNTEGKLGRLTTVSTNNLALDNNISIVDHATADLNGTPVILVGLGLP